MDTATCPCIDLAALFDPDRRTGEFAAKIDAPPGTFRCEREPVSARSTKRSVGDDELLIRVLIAPKVISRADPSRLDDNCCQEMCSTGLSVLRFGEPAASKAEIEKLARQLVDSAANGLPDNEYAECIGVLEFTCGYARSFLLEDKSARGVGVYESPTPDLPSHSDILIAVNKYPSKTKAKLASRNFLESVRGNFIAAAGYSKADIAGFREKGRRAST